MTDTSYSERVVESWGGIDGTSLHDIKSADFDERNIRSRVERVEDLQEHYKWQEDREALVEEIENHLSGREHIYSRDKEISETFEPSHLDMFELNQIHALLEGLEERAVRREIGQLVHADLSCTEMELHGIRTDGTEGSYTIDTGETELGGVVRFSVDRLIEFQSYEPENCFFGNGRYSPSTPRIEERPDSSTVLIPFHLHAIGEEDRQYAYPSDGDREALVDTQNNGLVVTYIGTADCGHIAVNIDWYTVEYAVDLGNYTTSVVWEGNEGGNGLAGI